MIYLTALIDHDQTFQGLCKSKWEEMDGGGGGRGRSGGFGNGVGVIYVCCLENLAYHVDPIPIVFRTSLYYYV